MFARMNQEMLIEFMAISTEFMAIYIRNSTSFLHNCKHILIIFEYSKYLVFVVQGSPKRLKLRENVIVNPFGLSSMCYY